MRQRLLVVFLAFSLLASSAFGTTTRKRRHRVVRPTTTAAKVHGVAYSNRVGRSSTAPSTVRRTSTGFKRRNFVSPWATPTFADSTIGDSVDGEDLMVRRAAVQALGPYNGSVVVADPST